MATPAPALAVGAAGLAGLQAAIGARLMTGLELGLADLAILVGVERGEAFVQTLLAADVTILLGQLAILVGVELGKAGFERGGQFRLGDGAILVGVGHHHGTTAHAARPRTTILRESEVRRRQTADEQRTDRDGGEEFAEHWVFPSKFSRGWCVDHP